MKKIFEFDIKSKVDIPYDSPIFEKLKDEIIESIKQKWGAKFENTAFQCNCIKIKERDENEEYTILIKVYAWPKLKEIEEINFFVNTEETSDESASHPQMQDKLKKYNLELAKLEDALFVINNKIDNSLDEMNKHSKTPEIIKTLTEDTEKKKDLESKIEKFKKQIMYIKSEFEL